MPFQIAVTTDGVFTMTVGGSSTSQVEKAKQTKATNINVPSARMKPGLAVCKGNLYLYGGEYESGSKQYTLNDFYSLGLLKFLHFISMLCYVKF